jgi:hypothetical protein
MIIAKDRKSQIPVQRTNYGHSDYGGAFHQTPNSPPTLLSSQSLTYLTQYYRTENHSGKCKAGPTTVGAAMVASSAKFRVFEVHYLILG